VQVSEVYLNNSAEKTISWKLIIIQFFKEFLVSSVIRYGAQHNKTYTDLT
jgi:hypothetical protein